MLGSKVSSMSKAGDTTIRGIREVMGRWQYRFRAAGRDFSKVTDLRATKRNLAAAAKQMEDHKARVVNGQAAPARPLSFNEVCTRFVAWSRTENAAKPNTWKRHRTSLASMREFFGGRLVTSLRPGDFEDFKMWRRENGIKEVTIRHDLHAASVLFQYARAHAWIAGDPLAGVKFPSDRESRNDIVLTDDEERRYLEAAKEYRTLSGVAVLMTQQGVRPAEALNLRKSDVDLERKTLLIREGKSKAARRTIHLTDESCQILGHRLPGDSEWLFPSQRKVWHRKRQEFYWVTVGRSPFTYSGLVNQHNEALKASELNFRLYTLRHTFATRLYAHSKDIAATARILGHSDLKTIMRYVHVSDEQVRAAMAAFEAAQKQPAEVLQ